MGTHLIKRVTFDGINFGFLFLVFLLGIFTPNEEELLNLSKNSLVALGCVVLGVVFSLIINKMGIKTLGELLFAPPHKKTVTSTPVIWYKTFWGVQTAGTVLLMSVLGYFVTEVNVREVLDIENIKNVLRLIEQLATPNWEVLPDVVWKAIQSVFIAFMATLIAVPIAFLLSFVSAKNIMGTTPVGFVIYMMARTLFNIMRSIEPIMWAIIFAIWVRFGPFAGMLALLVHSIASLSKQYSEIVECVDEGPIEGIESTGAGFLQTIWFAVVPQIVLPYISFTIYRWDINVRMATIIGFVGGGGVGELLLLYQRQSLWNEVGVVILVIAVIVWLMDNFSAYVREAIK